MYPLIPLKLFNLRKAMEKAQTKNDLNKLKELSYEARTRAEILIKESKELVDVKEVDYDDFHKMLLAITNLIEYLSKNYFDDDKIEQEVTTMTKTLIDPAIMEQGKEIGQKAANIKTVVKQLGKRFKSKRL